MRETGDRAAPLLEEMTALMMALERGAGFEDALGADYARLGSFCSRRRERIQVKSPRYPIMALVLDGEKRLGRERRVRPGEVLLIPAGRPIEVTNVPESPSRPYRSFVVHVMPQVAARLAARHPALADVAPPWAESRPRVLAPSRSTLLAVLHLARTLAEPDAHLEILRHRMEDVLLSVLLASGAAAKSAPRSHVHDDPVGAIRRLVRGEPARVWRAGEAAARVGFSEATLRRRLAEAGTSFRAILVDERMRLARALLGDRSLSVTAIALRCGYQSPSKFAAQFERAEGQSPSRFAALEQAS